MLREAHQDIIITNRRHIDLNNRKFLRLRISAPNQP